MANRKLTIEILGKDKTKNAVKSTEGGFKRLGNVLKSVGTIASGILASDAIQSGLNSLREGYRGAIDAAVDLGESTNAVGAIFGDFADQITTFGEESANALGLSRAEFQQLATPLGAMLKNSGMEMQNVTDSTIMLTERASDMASVFNTDVSEALSAVQAGLRGESDPLEQYGVRLSAAAVEAEALAMSGKSSADALTEQEKATARVNLIMSQTEAVAGDFADTSDQLANKTRVAEASMEDMRAEIGEKLLPIELAMVDTKLRLAGILTDTLVPALEDASAWFGEHLAPAIERAQEFVGGIIEDFRTGGERSSEFRDKIDPLVDSFTELWQSIQDSIDELRPVFEEFMTELIAAWREIEPEVRAAMDQVIATLTTLGEFLTAVVDTLTTAVTTLWEIMGDDVINIFRNLWSTVAGVMQGAWQVIQGLLNVLIGIFTGDFGKIREGVTQIFQGLWNIIVSILQGAWGILRSILSGIGSLFMESFRRIGGHVSRAMSGIVNSIRSAGSRMVSGIRSAISRAVGLARGLPGRISRAVGNLRSLLYRKGRDVIQGLINGIRSMVRRVRNSMSSITRVIGRFLPGSPVREGPLKVINNGWAGREIVRRVASGMEYEKRNLRGVFNDVLSSPSAPRAALVPTAVFGGPGAASVYIDMREAITPDSRNVEDFVVRALQRVGRRTVGRVAIAGRPL